MVTVPANAFWPTFETESGLNPGIFTLLNSLLVRGRRVSLALVLVHGDGHFLRIVVVRVDHAPCGFGVADSGHVLARARFLSDLRVELIDHAQWNHEVTGEHGIRRAGGAARRRGLSVCSQQEYLGYRNRQCCEPRWS
jgi:hypothetical protein